MTSNIVNKYKNLLINVKNEKKEKLSNCPYCNHSHILSCKEYKNAWYELCSERNKILLFKYFKINYNSENPEYIKSEKLKEIEILLGKLSGIPDCCIEAYVKGRDGRYMSKEIKEKIDTNYVLCEECKKYYLESKKI